MKRLVLLDPRVQELIKGRPYEFLCCAYVSDNNQYPYRHVLTITINMKDSSDQLSIGLDLEKVAITSITTGIQRGSSGIVSFNEEPSTRIEISFGKEMTRNFLPVVFSEITTNAESLDEITVWKFELIGHSGDDRRVVWDTVPKDTGIFYEITDDSGQDIIDHARMSENWAIPADQHVYNMNCDLLQTVEGESARPSAFLIKNNTKNLTFIIAGVVCTWFSLRRGFAFHNLFCNSGGIYFEGLA